MSAPLEKFPILDEMSPEDRESLTEFLEEKSFVDGRALFRRRDEAAEQVLLTAGRIRLESGGDELGELRPGAALGHASLVSIGKRACAAFAIGEVSVLKLSREAYLRMRADRPQLALALSEGLLRNFAETARKALPD